MIPILVCYREGRYVSAKVEAGVTTPEDILEQVASNLDFVVPDHFELYEGDKLLGRKITLPGPITDGTVFQLMLSNYAKRMYLEILSQCSHTCIHNGQRRKLRGVAAEIQQSEVTIYLTSPYVYATELQTYFNVSIYDFPLDIVAGVQPVDVPENIDSSGTDMLLADVPQSSMLREHLPLQLYVSSLQGRNEG